MKGARRARIVRGALCLFAAAVAAAGVDARVGPDLFSQMRWRMIGPFRGGRTDGAAGVPGQPNVFYIGVVNGGVWKTTDDGRTWKPIFDDQPTGSIGAIAVAPSNPDIIYVGSGEGLQRPDLSTGDGIYKSTDGGKTWTHLGLRDGQQIAQIVVDPRNPNRAVRRGARASLRARTPSAASSARPTAANLPEGALSRTRTPGRSTSSSIPPNPQTVYAVLWAARQGPWENGAFSGPGSGLFKSTDGGTTWQPLDQRPADAGRRPGPHRHRGRAERSAERSSRCVEAPAKVGGLYRSDDAGESWTRVNGDARIWGRGERLRRGQRPSEEPRHRLRRQHRRPGSRPTAGETFTAFHGAPGGDDYHRSGSTPTTPTSCCSPPTRARSSRSTAAQTWSSWYNQPTGAVLPRHHRQPLPVPRLRRPAGERLGLRREPRRRRADHVPRLAPGRRRGVRLRRARPAGSRTSSTAAR